jgi:hypothetical protein
MGCNYLSSRKVAASWVLFWGDCARCAVRVAETCACAEDNPLLDRFRRNGLAASFATIAVALAAATLLAWGKAGVRDPILIAQCARLLADTAGNLSAWTMSQLGK